MNRFELITTSHYPEYDVKVTLKPCFRCNQQCWFCGEYDNSTPMWSKKDCDNVVSALTRIPVEKKKMFIYIYGGEPTLSNNWEYLQLEIVKHLKDRELFIQTQTNMSLKKDRLDKFLYDINNTKQQNHVIDICSSYHLNKQQVDEFIDKMKVCQKHSSLGLCFVSTEIQYEEQFIDEFSRIASCFPQHTILKFTQIESKQTLSKPPYNKLMQDEYLRGNDNGEAIEYRYFITKYKWLEKYLEPGWNFQVDSKVMNYADVKSEGVYRMFKFMKCTAGRKNIVIDHDLNVSRCNDYYYSRIGCKPLDQVDIENYFKCDITCLNYKCTDGLDHTKYKTHETECIDTDS